MFTTHVRRTTQTLLDGSGLDLCALQHISLRVESLLQLPAPQFVHLIRRHPVLPALPLYKAYGESWLRIMDQRSRVCLAEDDLSMASDSIGISDLSQARRVLERIRKSS